MDRARLFNNLAKLTEYVDQYRVQNVLDDIGKILLDHDVEMPTTTTESGDTVLDANFIAGLSESVFGLIYYLVEGELMQAITERDNEAASSYCVASAAAATSVDFCSEASKKRSAGKYMSNLFKKKGPGHYSDDMLIMEDFQYEDEDDDDEDDNRAKSAPPAPRLFCNWNGCNKSFSCEWTRNRHIRRHNKTNLINRELCCELCDPYKSYPSKWALDRHRGSGIHQAKLAAQREPAAAAPAPAAAAEAEAEAAAAPAEAAQRIRHLEEEREFMLGFIEALMVEEEEEVEEEVEEEEVEEEEVEEEEYEGEVREMLTSAAKSLSEIGIDAEVDESKSDMDNLKLFMHFLSQNGLPIAKRMREIINHHIQVASA